MSEAFDSLDHGEQLVSRYRASRLTRKGFTEQSGISVFALDYYARRERSASLAAEFPPNRILPVEFVAPEEASPQANVPVTSTGIGIRLANGRVVEVERGFDAQLLRDLLGVLDAYT